MRCWLMFVLALSVFTGSEVRADPPVTTAVAPRGSFECRDTPLRNALLLLRSQSGLEIKLEEGLPDASVTLSLKDVPYEDILRVLVRQAAVTVPGLRVGKLGTIYAVHRAAAAEPPASPTLTPAFLRKISVGFRDEGLRQALARLFALTGGPLNIEPNVPNPPITVDFRNVTAWEGLRRILTAAQEHLPPASGKLSLGQVGEVYVVALRAPTGDDPQKPDVSAERITLKLDRVPLKLAAEALFRGTNYQYAFSPEPGDRTISLVLQDVPLEVALGRLEQEASRAGVRLTWTRN